MCPVYLQAPLVQGTGTVANTLARLEEGLHAGVVLEPLELQVGTQVGVRVVQAHLQHTDPGQIGRSRNLPLITRTFLIMIWKMFHT